MKADFLGRVEKAGTCTGCGLCAAVTAGITMAQAAPGYARPRQIGSVSLAEDSAIAAACPGLVVDERDHPHLASEPLWGPALFTGTGHAADAALRHQASSGGVISALLVHALETGLVDFIVQTRADPDRPMANITTVSASAADVFSAAGSRYAASSPLAGLEGWLARPGRFAFVGKPCDVTALRAHARRDPRIDARIPLKIAFFCAGIPSAAAGQRILDRLGVAHDDVAAFRYRGDGWPGFATATRRDGSLARMSYADSWGDILSKEVQFRCKICPDAVGGAADIACADAWYGDDRGYPSFEEGEGRSLIMARTAAGDALRLSAEKAGKLSTAPLAVTEIIKMQPHQARRKRQVLSRLWAMRVVGRPVPRFVGVGVADAARLEPLHLQLKSFAGLVRRFIRGTA
ncbi:Coenzyme F420 hydrogenase/dehydrogenase, beta subunit C-terminal domain [Sandarakinorhabdus sp.]|uniref:Coenzyme F420 hydrogenase/dehydrogenase, beta subunit C-terminal domain n=1 Tax=Sandarakinorhabdus sp. TaxID=1916663 RepID=UPI00286D7948|nr:Coenzyme F420 hydrogenase/dehydrogenase, beta subunit C-terminal domain [Sandarakinorhabdus sp.]